MIMVVLTCKIKCCTISRQTGLISLYQMIKGSGMANNSIQEYLVNQELLNKQNNIKEDSKNVITNNITKNELPEIIRLQGSREICSGMPNWREISVAVLYRPNQEEFPPTVVGYFVNSDDWDEQSLLELKERVGADFLVALQTDSNDNKRYFEYLDIVKCVIKCQFSEIQEVIKLLDVYSPRYGLLCLNVYDVKELFECSNSFQYIQASANGDPKLNLMKDATQQVINQLLEADDIKAIFVNAEGSEAATLDEMLYISKSIEDILPSNSVKEPYYGYSVCDQPDFFKLRAIYAESIEAIARDN